MNTVLLQSSLTPQEIGLLRKEFPQYKFLYQQLADESRPFGKTEWNKVEILYGNRISREQLIEAPNLHWIHSPTVSLSRLPIEKIAQRANVIITTVKDENVIPVAEFVMAGVLAFAKHLFHWRDLMSTPSQIWESPWRDSMWSLQNRIFLQVGLGAAGTEIARCAQQAGMQVWGVQEQRSFHPFCKKVVAFKDIASILPKADVVSICLPPGESKEDLFTVDELEAMKKDSILVVLGSHTIVNEQALVALGKTGKLRGILLDVSYRASLPTNSPVWLIPHALITPEVSMRPRLRSKQAFHAFHYNLRQYACGNFNDMRNRLSLNEIL